MTSPGCTLVGTLTDASGSPMAGVVTMTLCNWNPYPPVISGSNVFAQVQISVLAATNGTFSLPFYGNYQLSPSNTFYNIAVTPPGSNPQSIYNSSAWSNAYQFLSGGTFDLSTISPMNGSVPNPVVSPNYLTFAYEQVPTGTINGTNATFHLAQTPAPISSLNLFVNGIRQLRGTNFTITGNTVTYAAGSIPQPALNGNPADNHICDYTYNL